MHFSHGVITKQTVAAIGSLSHHTLLLTAKNNPGTDAAKSNMTLTQRASCSKYTPTKIISSSCASIVVFLDLDSYFCFHLSVIGWRAAIRPADHPVADFEFDVVVGADGRRNTLEGGQAGEFRGVYRGLNSAAIVWTFVTDRHYNFSCWSSVFVNLISHEALISPRGTLKD